MTKKHSIFVAIILVIASVVIEILIKNSNPKFEKDQIELVDFFAGILFGTSLGILIPLIFKKKPKH